MEMPKYHKNDEVFEAVLFTGGEDNAVEIVNWLREHGLTDAVWRKAYPEVLEDGEYIEMGKNSRRSIRKNCWVVMNDEEQFDLFTKEDFEKKYSLTENWDETVFNLNKHAFLRELLPMDEVYTLNKLREAVGLPAPDVKGEFVDGEGPMAPCRKVTAGIDPSTIQIRNPDGSWSPLPHIEFADIFNDFFKPPKKDVPIEEPTTFYTEIEALQYDGTDGSAMSIVRWVNRSGGVAKYVDGVLTIRKLYYSAVHIVKESQWVVRMPADGTFGVTTDEDLQKYYEAKVDAEPTDSLEDLGYDDRPIKPGGFTDRVTEKDPQPTSAFVTIGYMDGRGIRLIDDKSTHPEGFVEVDLNDLREHFGLPRVDVKSTPTDEESNPRNDEYTVDSGEDCTECRPEESSAPSCEHLVGWIETVDPSAQPRFVANAFSDGAGNVYDTTKYTEDTLFKVMRALMDCRIGKPQATDLINSMQNAGILFRERL